MLTAVQSVYQNGKIVSPHSPKTGIAPKWTCMMTMKQQNPGYRRGDVVLVLSFQLPLHRLQQRRD